MKLSAEGRHIDAHRFRTLIAYMVELQTPYLFAICTTGVPLAMSARMRSTSTECNFLVGWWSPLKFASPMRHWCREFSANDTHSKFSARLSSLLPFL